MNFSLINLIVTPTLSDDLHIKKLVKIAWKIIYSHITDGGLCLRLPTHINDASMLKLCWEMFNSNNQWAVF